MFDAHESKKDSAMRMVVKPRDTLRPESVENHIIYKTDRKKPAIISSYYPFKLQYKLKAYISNTTVTSNINNNDQFLPLATTKNKIKNVNIDYRYTRI